jgi:hypothetical protein
MCQPYWASNLLGFKPRNGSTVCEYCGSRRGSSSKHRCSSVFISYKSLSPFAFAFSSVCSVYSVVPYPFFYGECLPASATCRFPLLLPMGTAPTKSSFILSGCTSHFDRKPFRNCRFPLSSNIPPDPRRHMWVCSHFADAMPCSVSWSPLFLPLSQSAPIATWIHQTLEKAKRIR